MFYSYDEDPIGVPLDKDKKVTLTQIPLFKNIKRWESAFLVNEGNGELTPIEKDMRAFRPAKGSKFAVLFYTKKETQRQLHSLRDDKFSFQHDSASESIFGLAMSRAVPFWNIFPKIFLLLSRFEKDLELESDIEKFKYLICPGSLNASLLQMALSINAFVKLQLVYADTLSTEQDRDSNHFSTSLNYLNNLNLEVDDFIRALSNYLRKNKQDAATVSLISQFTELERHDKKVKEEEEKYKIRPSREINSIKISEIFGDDRCIAEDLKSLVYQRIALTTIFNAVDEIMSNDEPNVPKILILLKFLKELISSEIIHFIHANAFEENKKANSTEHIDCDDEHIDEQYKKLYELWKLVGLSSQPFSNSEDVSLEWSSLKEEILNIQRVAETAFHEIMNSTIQKEEDESD